MPLERKITGRVLSSMRDDPRFGSCAVEIKVARGKTLGARELKEHQYRALKIASESVLYHKIADGGLAQSPFDGFILKKTEAYLVIWYQLEKEKAHEVWAIPIAKVTEGRSVTLTWAIENGVLVNC